MSLKVNGVTIPETNGAIKVGATNVQKVVVNNTTVWEVPQGYTISWSASLSQYGTFINSTSPASQTTTNFGGKQIRYTKPDGSIAVANPYQAGSITIKKVLQFTWICLQVFPPPNLTSTGSLIIPPSQSSVTLAANSLAKITRLLRPVRLLGALTLKAVPPTASNSLVC